MSDPFRTDKTLHELKGAQKRTTFGDLPTQNNLQSIRRALAFGMSAIKGREKWSDDCKAVFDEGFRALEELESNLA